MSIEPTDHIRRAHTARHACKAACAAGNMTDAWIFILKAAMHAAAASGKLMGPAIYKNAPDGTDIGIKRK